MFSVKDSNGNNLSFANVVLETRDFSEGIYIFHRSEEVLLLPWHEQRGVIRKSCTLALPLGEIDFDEKDLHC